MLPNQVQQSWAQQLWPWSLGISTLLCDPQPSPTVTRPGRLGKTPPHRGKIGTLHLGWAYQGHPGPFVFTHQHAPHARAHTGHAPRHVSTGTHMIVYIQTYTYAEEQTPNTDTHMCTPQHVPSVLIHTFTQLFTEHLLCISHDGRLRR